MTEIEAGSAIMFLCSWGGLSSCLNRRRFFQRVVVSSSSSIRPRTCCTVCMVREDKVPSPPPLGPHLMAPARPPLRARLGRRRRRRRGLFRSLNIPPLPPICARFSLWKREEVIFRPLPPSLTSGAASLFVRSDGGWKCDNNGVSSQPAAGAGERERESPLFDLDGAGIRQR